MKAVSKIEVVLFDYDGVLAEEGFREGLKAIAAQNGLSPVEFFEMATEAVHDSEYLVGRASESHYWDILRQRSGIKGTEDLLRREILTRFVLRPWMLELVRTIRRQDRMVAALSDQTNWLDELNYRDDFFKDFDVVFNSYHIGMSKRNPAVFPYVADRMGVAAAGILFVDDTEGHIERAASQGLKTILFRDRESFMAEMKSLNLL